MAVIRPRSRMVYFRVTEEEFLKLDQACRASGARSISDLARHAIEGILQNGGDRVEDNQGQMELLRKIDLLTKLVEKLEARLTSSAAKDAGGEA